MDVRNIYVAFAPIGFDMVNNNFGSSFTNCRTLFDFCRIGVGLRGHDGAIFGSGNDIPFYNCWFHGREAGVWMEGLGGGYHFHGGQIAAGEGAADSDTRGAVTVGPSIETGLPLGSCDATFVGVSFESIVNGWNVRGIGSGTSPNGLRLRFYGCSFFGGNSAADNAHGVLKITGAYDDLVIFNGCAVNRVYTESTPVSMGTNPGSQARPYYEETGTFGNPTLGAGGGTPTSPRMLNTPMFELSQVIRGRMDKGFATMFNGMMLRNRTGGFLEFSTDWGATWQRVFSTPAP